MANQTHPRLRSIPYWAAGRPNHGADSSVHACHNLGIYLARECIGMCAQGAQAAFGTVKVDGREMVVVMLFCSDQPCAPGSPAEEIRKGQLGIEDCSFWITPFDRRGTQTGPDHARVPIPMTVVELEDLKIDIFRPWWDRTARDEGLNRDRAWGRCAGFIHWIHDGDLPDEDEPFEAWRDWVRREVYQDEPSARTGVTEWRMQQ